MKDSDIEDLLRRYRPVGPAASLRERVVAAGAPRRIWPWAGAAAALLVSFLGFRAAAGYELRSADVSPESALAVSPADDLAELLGGDAAARELAALIVVEHEFLKETALVTPMATDALAGELR
jgi:hypothetical protein